MIEPLAGDERPAAALRDRVADPVAAHVDPRLVRRDARVDRLERLEGRADQPPPDRPRRAEVLPEDDPGERAVVLDVDVRRVRVAAAVDRQLLRGDAQVQAGDPARPHARGALRRPVAPGDDGVALGRDRDPRPQRARPGLERRIDVERLRDRGPRRVLQARGAHVALLLPDGVGGAVDAEVDVDVVRVRPADLRRSG